MHSRMRSDTSAAPSVYPLALTTFGHPTLPTRCAWSSRVALLNWAGRCLQRYGPGVGAALGALQQSQRASHILRPWPSGFDELAHCSLLRLVC